MAWRNHLITLLAIFSLAFAPSVFAQDDEDGRRKPPTKVTEKLSPKVYKIIAEAQKAMEEKNINEAERILNELKADSEKLNDYEKAQMYNFLAAVHYEQGKNDQTIRDYIAIVKLEKAPEQIKNNSLFRLAQLYFVKEDYSKSVRALRAWMKKVDNVRPEAHMLEAQAWYQLEKYAKAKPAIIRALKEARKRKQKPAESWLGLLRAVYYELEDYKSAAKVLSQLLKVYPKEAYYKQLSGMLGLMKSQKGQMLVMHAAKEGGMLKNEFEILNMARLYMAEEAPFAAAELMFRGMSAGTVKEDAANLQLLAQALALAKEHEAQIPILEKAAGLSGSATQYLYLGQAQMALYRWGDAAKSLSKAVRIGGLNSTGSVYMQIGTAYYNLKRFSKARQAFKEASAYPRYAKQARQWVSFVNKEVEREKALEAL